NVNGTVTLYDCTVSDNSSNVNAGGGLFNSGGAAALTNCTVSGNTASNSGGSIGGGLFIMSTSNGTGTGYYGTVTLTNCTVSGNTAMFGSGLYNLDGTATLTNTILAGNSGGGTFGDGGYSGSNNLIGGNPMLSALGDFGGPTPTMALLPGS